MAYNDAPTPTPKLATVSSAIEDLDAVIGRLEQYVERVSACADRITGARPREVSTGKRAPEAPMAYLLSSIQARRERLVCAVDYLEHELERLQSGIG